MEPIRLDGEKERVTGPIPERKRKREHESLITADGERMGLMLSHIYQ
jgi:hypothetical protein